MPHCNSLGAKRADKVSESEQLRKGNAPNVMVLLGMVMLLQSKQTLQVSRAGAMGLEIKHN
jgi:hypothetical protein